MASSEDFYDRHAEIFVASTFFLDMRALYNVFVNHVTKGGHILDAGCGSGRDALFFRQQGYLVTAFDSSPAIVSLARRKTGLPIQQRSFSEVEESIVYDGIWACASLLHVSLSQIPETIARLWQALKPGGILYMSFKFGEGEREQDGRHFTDANETIAGQWIEKLHGTESCRMWRTEDRRPDRDEQWLNILVSKAFETRISEKGAS